MEENSITILEEPKKFRKAIYISALVAAMGGFICGYDTGAISGILAMPTFQAYFFTEENMTYLQGLLLALYLMTAALGAFIAGFLCDRFSRKYSIIAASAIFCIGILLEIIGVNFGLLLAGRLIGGFGSGLMNSAIPLYHSEIAPADIRGRLISFFTLMASLGQVTGYFVTFGTSYVTTNWSWRGPWLLHIIVCIIFTGIMTQMPFSPRWLIDKGRYDEGLEVLMELHEVTDPKHVIVSREYNEIVQEIEFEHTLGDVRYVELFVGTNLKRTLISFFISISTSFTGYAAIGYYAPQIIQNAGLSDASTSIAATGGTGILSLLMAFVSLQWFIDRVGRKPVFLIGASIMGISMFIVGALFQVYIKVDVESYVVMVTNVYARNAIIAFLYIFMGTYQFSWGTVSYVYPAEVFNMRTRAKGLALTYALNWGFSILITYCVPLFLAHTVSGVYFFFGSCCCICFIGCCFIPETKGKTLEEMEYVFGAKG
ncbi:general substrate transporter [Cokeromyces recurvatus]|uniref:general substrate transporter n=1 Tax=Cokeromyces recurvatus TaxID=90255 RepID=UPI0022211B31|nr:general substrate transporter [Cokeromyces recurvatus]KAI7906281.1 general substrate transporter [Cokeromyces recurvatus]